MRTQWIVTAILLISLMLPTASTVAEGTEVAEQTWVSADLRSADNFIVVIVTVFSASDSYGLNPGVALSVATDVIYELQESGVPDSTFRYESIGDEDWSQKILVTASQSVFGQIAIWGLTSIASGEFVQRVVAMSTTLSEREMRKCLLDLAKQLPGEALTADELMLDGASVSAAFGVELNETTLGGLRMLKAGTSGHLPARLGITWIHS